MKICNITYSTQGTNLIGGKTDRQADRRTVLDEQADIYFITSRLCKHMISIH